MTKEGLPELLSKGYAVLESNDENFFEYFQELAELLGPVLQNEEYCQKYGTLRKLLKEFNYSEELAYLIRDIFEEQIIRQIRQIAVLQYRHMQTTKDWGDLGEQRISISYCRHLLNIPNDLEVTQLDADRFNQQLEILGKPWYKAGPIELRRQDESIKCNLFYKVVDYSREKDIHFMLSFLESDKGLIAGQLGIYRSVIFGLADIRQIDVYRTTVFQTEIARTPANVLSIAAVVGGKHIAIRKASCETIFANKWLQAFKLTDQEIFFSLLNDHEHIGLVFKIISLILYKTRSMEELKNKKGLFLQEMEEGLLWHELGHGIVINNLLSTEDSAFGEALGVLGANIISVMKEILADWAPKHGQLQGPMHHFCRIAEKSKIKASRMLQVYFSDNWFLGGESDAFDNHTVIMLSLIIKHVKAAGEFDFVSLRQDLQPGKEDIFSHTLSEYKRITKHLEKQLYHSEFNYEEKKIGFAELKQIYTVKARQIEKEAPEDSLEFLVLLWAKILEDLPRLNYKLMEELNLYLAAENTKYHNYLIERYLGLPLPPDSEPLHSILLNLLKTKGYWFNTPPNSKIEISELYQKTFNDLLQYFG